MKKMTLAQKKRRLKAIKADLAKHAKKPQSIGTLPNLRVPVGRFATMPELLTLASMVSAEAREADALPGEWVKLPPMTWPETLPVKIPQGWVYEYNYSDNYSQIDDVCCPAPRLSWDIVYETWKCILHSKPIQNWRTRQAAWSELLVRLGYTEDA